MHVDMYTDGSCLKAHESGGYAYILIYDARTISFIRAGDGAYRNTTNNRMEMTAVIKGFQLLTRSCEVCVYTDSKLISDMFNNHIIDKWAECHFRRNGRKLKNEDLWRNLLKEVSRHDVTFIHIRGHSGNIMNEMCDRLAYKAAKGIDDEGHREIDE